MAGTTVSDEPVAIELDQTKRNYLHPVAGSEAVKQGAGLFLKPTAKLEFALLSCTILILRFLQSQKGFMRPDEMLDVLLSALRTESHAAANIAVPEDTAGKWRLLRALMNIRPPIAISPELLDLQDRLLSAQREAKGVTGLEALPSVLAEFPGTWIPFADRLILWRGDITTLAADAIVNAANDRLLGCFIPHHRCIDNAIHSAAGIQLRLECNEIMRARGYAESSGQAKITRGYNLPSRYVLHTVGPIITDDVTEAHERRLASCSTACLNLAAQHADIRSVAFCCISTGEFRFPGSLAAEIAVQTVCDWMKGSDRRMGKVVFNVFTQEDYDIYAGLFRAN